MTSPVALIIGGSIVYLVNDSAGALMIAAGCAFELVKWLDRILPRGEHTTQHERQNTPRT